MRYLLGLALAAAVTGSAGAQSAAERQQAAALVQQGIALQNQKDLRGALTPLYAAIRLDPNNAEAHAQLAGSLADLSQTADATREVNIALELDQRNQHAWWVAGIMAVRRNAFASAADLMGKVVEINPKVTDAWSYRGHALFQLGRSAEAADAFQHALAVDPSSSLAKNNLAVVQAAIRTGKPRPPQIYTPAGNPTVQRLIAEAAKTQPDAGYAAGRKALARKILTGQANDDYIADFGDKAVLYAPADADAWVVAAQAHLHRDLKTAAIEPALDAYAMFSRAIELDPRNGVALRERGAIRLTRGELDEAVSDFKAALAVNGADAAAAQGLSHATAQRARWGRSFDGDATRSLAEGAALESEADMVVALERGGYPEVEFYAPEAHRTVTPLTSAVRRGESLVALKLLSAGAAADPAYAVDMARAGAPGSTQALASAAFLKAMPAPRDISDLDRALVAAAEGHSPASIEILVDRGAAPNRRTGQGMSAMEACVQSCDPRTLTAMIAHGGNARGARSDGESYTDVAADAGRVGSYLVLRCAGAPPARARREYADPFVEAVAAAPAGSPLARYANALTSGDAAGARAVAAQAHMSGDVLQGAFVAALQLDDPDLLAELIAAGADQRRLVGQRNIFQLATATGARKAETFFYDRGMREPAVSVASAAPASPAKADLALIKDRIDKAAIDFRRLNDLIGARENWDVLEICRIDREVDNELIDIIRAARRLRGHGLPAAMQAQIDQADTAAHDQRSSVYSAYARFSCKFGFIPNEKL